MIGKYLDAFPYSHSYISKDNKKLFYLEGKTTLKMLDLEKSQNRAQAVVVCDEDFSKRNYRSIVYDENLELLYIESDDHNKENFNIYALDPKRKSLTQITHTTYCGIYGFNDDYTTLVYGDRYKTHEGRFYTKLYLRNLKSNDTELLADDFDWEYRFSWSNISFSQDMHKVYVSVDKNNQRKQRNILSINLKTKECIKLIPKEYESALCYTVGCLLKSDDFYFMSECCGHDNLYHLDLSNQQVTKLTDLKESPNSIIISKDHKEVYLAIDENHKNRTAIIKIAPKKNSASITTNYLDGSNSFFTNFNLWIASSNIDKPPFLTLYNFDKELNEIKSINNYQGENTKLVHNEYQFIEYSSFDKKMVPAFISIPKTKIKGAIIKAFYGGSNYYSWVTQLYSELGFIVLSPGVRGSWDYGKTWRDFIKNDLGGDEILDVHWGAKFLQEKYNLMPSQIGLEGGSHGGYAVLRGLTMPKNFKDDADCDYDYGFGICWAGFADLEDFYHKSNIPDWLVDMLGPYEENKHKYRDRSPVNHFENLKAPLFIAHGTNDVRVPSSSMETFLDKLKASDKEYIIHIMQGLGHGAGNKEEELIMYQKIVTFLNQRQLSQD